MLRFAIAFVSERTVHPVFASLLGLGVALLAAGYATDVFGRGLTAGFLGVYASMLLFLGGVGYGLTFAGKFARKLWRQYELEV